MSALSGYVFSQDMDEDPRKILERASSAAACIGKLDQNLIQEMTRKGEKNQLEMERLCAAGKRKEAQAKAVSIYEKAMKDPISIKLKACTDLLGSGHVTKDTSANICDTL